MKAEYPLCIRMGPLHFIKGALHEKDQSVLRLFFWSGIMALALFTACSDSDPGNPEFDPKVESAYLDALNKTFGTSFENDADIKRLAIEHIEEKHGADSLTGETLWKTKGDEKTVVRQVQLCFDGNKKSKPDAFVPLFYEAARTANHHGEPAQCSSPAQHREG